MFKHSRAIYNSGIYFQRQMFYLRRLMIKYYIHNIDDFYNQFSLDDIIYIILEIIKNNTNLSNFELYVCHKLLNNIYLNDISYIKKRISHKQINDIIDELIKNNKLKSGKSKSIYMSYKSIADTLQNLFITKIKFPFQNNESLEEFTNNTIHIFYTK